MIHNDVRHGPPAFAAHLDAVLGLQTPYAAWAGADALPLLLRRRFTCWQGAIRETPVVFAVDQDPTEATPAKIAKLTEALRNACGQPVVYVGEHLTALHRQRLIAYRVPFVIPGKQIYLPPLGIDLREQFHAPRQPGPHLTPAAQLLFLAILLDRMPKDAQDWVPRRLADYFAYRPMTLVRAFNELEQAELATTVEQGRRRVLVVDADRQELWQRALPRLRSPVLRAHHVAHATEGCRAGLTALAQRTMLADPGPTTIAVTQEAWKAMDQTPAIADDAEATQVQVWAYDPALLTPDAQVDPLSLYLSLRDDPDDRTQIACEALLKDMPW